LALDQRRDPVLSFCHPDHPGRGRCRVALGTPLGDPHPTRKTWGAGIHADACPPFFIGDGNPMAKLTAIMACVAHLTGLPQSAQTPAVFFGPLGPHLVAETEPGATAVYVGVGPGMVVIQRDGYGVLAHEVCHHLQHEAGIRPWTASSEIQCTWFQTHPNTCSDMSLDGDDVQRYYGAVGDYR